MGFKEKNNHTVCGADILIKLQLDVTLGNLQAFVCYASIIVNDKLHTSIVTIKSFQLGAVFVECIARWVSKRFDEALLTPAGGRRKNHDLALVYRWAGL